MGWLPDFQAKVELTSLDKDVESPVRTLRFRPSCVSYKIGRASKSLSKGIVAAEDNAWFDSPVMSRNHAEIYINPDIETIMLKDIGSLHGTFLNGTQVERFLPIPLSAGDTIVFGAPVARNGETFPPCSFEVSIDLNDKSLYSNTFTMPSSSDAEEEPYNIISDEETQHVDISDSSDASSVVEEVFMTKVDNNEDFDPLNLSLSAANGSRNHIVIDSDEEDEEMSSSGEEQELEAADSDLSDSASEDMLEDEIEDLEEEAATAAAAAIHESEIMEYANSSQNITSDNANTSEMEPPAQQSYGMRFEVPDEVSDDEAEDDHQEHDSNAKLESTLKLSGETKTPADSPWLQANNFKFVAETPDLYGVSSTKLPDIVVPPQRIHSGPYTLPSISKSELLCPSQRPDEIWEESGSNITENMSDKKEFFDAWAENRETFLKYGENTPLEHEQQLPLDSHDETFQQVEREFSPTPFYGHNNIEEHTQSPEFDMTSAVTFNKSKQGAMASNTLAERSPSVAAKPEPQVNQAHRSKVTINDIIDNVSPAESSKKKRKIDQISDLVEEELQTLTLDVTQQSESHSLYQQPLKKLKSAAEIAGWVALGGVGIFSILVATAPDL